MADAQLTKIPTPTRCKEFCHMATAMAVLIQCIRRRLLAISASKQVESFYRAVQRATEHCALVIRIFRTEGI